MIWCLPVCRLTTTALSHFSEVKVVDVALAVIIAAALFVLTMSAHFMCRSWLHNVGEFYCWYAVSLALTLIFLRLRRR
jgi:hypothetical protein